jgi:predicted transcriptional regulator
MEAYVSISEAGRQLGIASQAISEWIDSLGIETQRHPSNARARALTVKQVATLREAIEAGRRVVAQSA